MTRGAETHGSAAKTAQVIQASESVDIVNTVQTDIAVLSGSPDASELAAVTAVLAAVLDELAAEQGRRELVGPSAWARSQRGVRSPIAPGPGAWRTFSG